MNIYKYLSFLTAVILTPLVAFAQRPDFSYFNSLITGGFTVVVRLVPLLVGIAVVVFIWGVIKYIYAGDSEEARVAGRQLMIYGIIAIFVIVSIWGFIFILQNLFGVWVNTPLTPAIPSSSGSLPPIPPPPPPPIPPPFP